MLPSAVLTPVFSRLPLFPLNRLLSFLPALVTESMKLCILAFSVLNQCRRAWMVVAITDGLVHNRGSDLVYACASARFKPCYICDHVRPGQFSPWRNFSGPSNTHATISASLMRTTSSLRSLDKSIIDTFRAARAPIFIISDAADEHQDQKPSSSTLSGHHCGTTEDINTIGFSPSSCWFLTSGPEAAQRCDTDGHQTGRSYDFTEHTVRVVCPQDGTRLFHVGLDTTI